MKTQMQVFLFGLFAADFIGFVTSAKILVLHPVYARSHVFAIRIITDELVKRGHQVRVVRWLESSEMPTLNTPNLTETVLAVDNSDGSVPLMSVEKRAMFQFPNEYMWEKGLQATSVFAGGMLAVAASCKTLFENKALIDELRKENFSVAIVDMLYNECGLALAHHLGLPVVGYWAFFFTSGETQYTTAFNPPSTLPHLYTAFTNKMGFFERLINAWYGLGSHIVMQLHFSYTNFYIQKHLSECPHPSELIANVSGMLINSHWSFDYPKQLPPSFYHIGGFHIKESSPLPPDLLEFMESSEGVILFSLGMNFDSKFIPRAYFEAFSRLKQKVIVKLDIQPSYIPPNVKVMSYIPQNDILAHPKTILFMTHCGMHGVMEAIHHEVKMIAIPIFFDQMNVAVRLVDHGVAIALDKDAKGSEIYEAITEVVSDKRYEENIKYLSAVYHNSFEDPLQRAIWAIEHTIKFKGANHLKLPSKDLNFVQFFGLDIALFILCLGIIFIYIFYKFIKLIYGKILGKKYSYQKLKTR